MRVNRPKTPILNSSNLAMASLLLSVISAVAIPSGNAISEETQNRLGFKSQAHSPSCLKTTQERDSVHFSGLQVLALGLNPRRDGAIDESISERGRLAQAQPTEDRRAEAIRLNEEGLQLIDLLHNYSAIAHFDCFISP